MRGVASDEAKVAKCTQTLKNKLQGYERILSQQKYMGGDVRKPEAKLRFEVERWHRS